MRKSILTLVLLPLLACYLVAVVKADFVYPTFNVIGMGTINPAQGPYGPGQTLLIGATPFWGWQFSHFHRNGIDDSSENPHWFQNLQSGETFTAVFILEQEEEEEEEEYGSGPNLITLPAQVAAYFGIGEFAAKYLVSGVGLLFATVFVAYAMKKTADQAIMYGILITDFVLLGVFVALGWVDYWVFLIVCLIVALMMSQTLRDMITGR